MGLGGILFNPNGRIGPNQFWRGLIVLVGLQIILNLVSVYGPLGLTLILGFVSIIFIYPYLCVFGKRLHDANQSAWWFVAFLVAWLVLGIGGGAVLQQVIPGQAELAAEMEAIAATGDLGAVMELAREQSRTLMIPSIALTIAINFLIGFPAARLKSEPGPNQYGQATDGSASAGDTFS